MFMHSNSFAGYRMSRHGAIGRVLTAPRRRGREPQLTGWFRDTIFG